MNLKNPFVMIEEHHEAFYHWGLAVEKDGFHPRAMFCFIWTIIMIWNAADTGGTSILHSLCRKNGTHLPTVTSQTSPKEIDGILRAFYGFDCYLKDNTQEQQIIRGRFYPQEHQWRSYDITLHRCFHPPCHRAAVSSIIATKQGDFELHIRDNGLRYDHFEKSCAPPSLCHGSRSDLKKV